MNQFTKVQMCCIRAFRFLFYCILRTLVSREKEMSMVKAVNLDKLRGLLGIRKMDRMLNIRVTELCKGRRVLIKGLMVVSPVIWHTKKNMETSRIGKIVYKRECIVSCIVGCVANNENDASQD